MKKMTFSRYSSRLLTPAYILLLACCIFLVTPIASANPITVQNHSFEGTLSPWSTSSGNFGAIKASIIDFNGLIDGSWVAWSNGDTVSQVLTTTALPDYTYTLTALVGARESISFGGFEMTLGTAGGDIFEVMADHQVPNSGQTNLWTSTFETPSDLTAFGPDLSLIISFNIDGIQTVFDNVTLSGVSSAVPEPTTMLLLGFGLIGLAGARRKMKKRKD